MFDIYPKLMSALLMFDIDPRSVSDPANDWPDWIGYLLKPDIVHFKTVVQNFGGGEQRTSTDLPLQGFYF